MLLTNLTAALKITMSRYTAAVYDLVPIECSHATSYN